MILTRTLICINVLVFGWMIVTGGGIPYAVNGAGTGEFYYLHGAMRPVDVTAGGQWWRIVSSAFVHFGVLHIGMNMIALNYVGAPVEQLYGKVRYALVYALALVGAGISVVLFSPPDQFTAGASGAIFGLFGALVAAGLRLGPARTLADLERAPGDRAEPRLHVRRAEHLGGGASRRARRRLRRRTRAVHDALAAAPRRAYAYAAAPDAGAAPVETIEQPPDAGPHEELDAPPLEARDPRE